jgi:multicomponent Na+:H+ antiporter subunit F
MNTLLAMFTVFLLLNLAAGLVRAYRGPSPSDRMSAALLFGSTMVAVLLVVAELDGQPALRDVALLFVMLAAILSVAFVGMPALSAVEGREGVDDTSEAGPGLDGASHPAGERRR